MAPQRVAYNASERFYPAPWGDLAAVLLLSAILRLTLFSGFVMGDDAGYGDLVHQILVSATRGFRSGFPVAVDLNVFATRPLLLGLVASSIAAFGWTEFAFVLPVLLASLVSIAAAYAIGYLAAGRRAALFSSATLALLPLDVVYSTTMTNDIVVTALSGAGAALALMSLRNERGGRLWLAALGGVLTGAAVAVKLSALVLAIPLFGLVAPGVIRRTLTPSRAAAIIGGWTAAQLAIALFFRVTAGDWLAHVRVERAFNRAYMVEPYSQDVRQVLLTYPNWLLGLAPVGPINHTFFPFGLFVPIAAACALVALCFRRRELGFLVVWFAALLLAFEFLPLEIWPRYVPIHRLPRFVHPAMLPGAVLIGTILCDATTRTGWRRVAGVAVGAAYVVTSLEASIAAASRHRDVMADQRFAASIALQYSGPVASDPELLNFIRFRSGYTPSKPLVALASQEAVGQEPVLVLLGGSRRIDLDPAYVSRYEPTVIPPEWIKFADMPGVPSPWRLRQGTAYVAGGGLIAPATVRDDTPQLMDACPAGSRWRLRDVIDVGEVASESAHGYRIDSPTWEGRRTMLDHDRNRTDDGRAFRGWQEFTVNDLKDGMDVCVAVRIDARVRNQATRWLTGNQQLGITDTGTLAAEGRWRTKIVTVPGASVREGQMALREEFTSSDADVNVFRIEVFQVDPGVGQAARPR